MCIVTRRDFVPILYKITLIKPKYQTHIFYMYTPIKTSLYTVEQYFLLMVDPAAVASSPVPGGL